MRIGLTFFLHKKPRSIWDNGGDQHCIFLLQLLSTLPGVEVVAINAGEAEKPSPGMMMNGIEFRRMEDVADSLDLLIEMAAQIEPAAAERVHARGGRVVAYRYGNAYVIDSQRIVFGRTPGSILNGTRFDEVWTNPQHERTCRAWWEINYRCPVRVLPHVWSPMFCDAVRMQYPGVEFGWKPHPGPQRVVVAEPNIDIVKTCLTPLLICEVAQRSAPDLLGDVYVLCSAQLKPHLTFERFASHLDVVQARSLSDPAASKCSFEWRYKLPWFLAKYGDILLSHQWENGLNYAWYDALYGGYPVVHNSDLLPAGVGYHYSGFDAREGGEVLMQVMREHAQRADQYALDARRFLMGLLPTAPGPREAHTEALRQVLERPARTAA